MEKKEKIFNTLYWINIICWVLLIISSVYLICFYSSYSSFYKVSKNCGILDPCTIRPIAILIYYILNPIILLLSIFILIVSIKTKNIKKIIMTTIIILSMAIFVSLLILFKDSVITQNKIQQKQYSTYDSIKK